MDENWKERTFQHFFVLLGWGFNGHLSNFLRYSHEALIFFLCLPTPLFLGFKTVKLIWLMQLFYLQSRVVSTVWRLLTQFREKPEWPVERQKREMWSLYWHCVPWSRWQCWALLLCDAQVDTGTFTWVKPRQRLYSQEEGVLGEDVSTQGRGLTTGSLATFACFLKVYGFRCHQLRRPKMLCNLILTKLIL